MWPELFYGWGRLWRLQPDETGQNFAPNKGWNAEGQRFSRLDAAHSKRAL